jgi:hypothetical protein
MSTNTIAAQGTIVGHAVQARVVDLDGDAGRCGQLRTLVRTMCNVIWECDLTNTWKRVPPKQMCPTSCPAALTRTLPGACEVKERDAAAPLCEYAEGICGCTKSREWKCVGRTLEGGELSECPLIRPAGGTKGCPSEDHWPRNDLSCRYGDEELRGAVSADCLHHSWTLVDHREDSVLRP